MARYFLLCILCFIPPSTYSLNNHLVITNYMLGTVKGLGKKKSKQ